MDLQSTNRTTIYYAKPQSQEEILSVLEILKQRQTVILNLEKLEPHQARQAADLMAGCSCAIDGKSIRIDRQTFLYAPRNILVN